MRNLECQGRYGLLVRYEWCPVLLTVTQTVRKRQARTEMYSFQIRHSLLNSVEPDNPR